MSQLELAVDELKKLPQSKVAQVATYIEQLRDLDFAERRRALVDTAGCMTTAEADAFERAIEEGCERIDRD